MLLLSNASHAFNSQGHSVICQMAYQQTAHKTQHKIDQLMSKSPFKSFAEACYWPDRVRSQSSYKHTKTWHYINVPRTAQTVKAEHCGEKGCILSALQAMQKKLADRSNSAWQPLLFLAHLVGDLHQPLHVSFADDVGGNATRVQVGKNKTNLHAYWDGMLLERQPWRQQSMALLAGIIPEQRQQWQQGNFASWATDSLHITHEAYRLLPPSGKLNDSYRLYFTAPLEQQLQKASVRLAALLDEALIMKSY